MFNEFLFTDDFPQFVVCCFRGNRKAKGFESEVFENNLSVLAFKNSFIG